MVAPETSDNTREPDDDSDSTAKSRRRLYALLALMIFLILVCCLIALSQMVAVPDVVELGEEEARDDGAISTFPISDGSSPDRGTGSGGIPGATGVGVDTRPLTPSVQNVLEADAIATLKGAGYKPVIGGYGPTTAGVLAGYVYYQDPPPGTRLSRGGTITLWVSSGGPYDGYSGLPYPRPGH